MNPGTETVRIAGGNSFDFIPRFVKQYTKHGRNMEKGSLFDYAETGL